MSFVIMSCASLTPYEKCHVEDEWKRYGSLDECVSVKKSEENATMRSMGASLQSFGNSLNNSNRQRTVECRSYTDSYSGYTKTVCE